MTINAKNMTLNEYQAAALTTATYPDKYKIIYPALGLNGEAGEVAEKVKKAIRDHGGDLSAVGRENVVREVGDVLWYCAVMARDLGYKLEDVAQWNIAKLRSRKERGALGGSGDDR